MANQYDDAIKALCAADLTGLCRWLGVEPGPEPPRRLSEAAPAATTRTVDLLLAVDPATALHVEFQTRPEAGFALRMLDYWVRLRSHPALAGRRIEQHAVLLGEGLLVKGYCSPRVRFTYTVHHLADEDPERFLADLHLTPFATLARMPPASRPAMLARVLRRLADLDDRDLRQRLIGAALNLAAIRLDRVTIDTTLEESGMPIPSLLNEYYDEWRERGREEGREKGLEEGREEGRENGLAEAAASLLRVRFGDDERIDGLAARLARHGAAECMQRIEAAAGLDELI